MLGRGRVLDGGDELPPPPSAFPLSPPPCSYAFARASAVPPPPQPLPSASHHRQCTRLQHLLTAARPLSLSRLFFEPEFQIQIPTGATWTAWARTSTSWRSRTCATRASSTPTRRSSTPRAATSRSTSTRSTCTPRARRCCLAATTTRLPRPARCRARPCLLPPGWAGGCRAGDGDVCLARPACGRGAETMPR